MNNVINISQFNKSDVLASVVRDSFFAFVREFWFYASAEKPIWNWHIKYLCDVLQDIAYRVYKEEHLGYDYLIINIPPKTTKSILVSVMFPSWVWTWWPSASFIGSSYKHELAVRMSRLNRTIVKSPIYQQSFPKTKLVDDQDTKSDFANISKGERMTVGIGGDIIGRHANFILPDDLLDPKAARSELELERANLHLLETLRTRKKNIYVPTMMIMQRLHENDPTGMLLNKFKDKVRLICIPAELTDNVQPPEIRKYYVNGLLDPIRMPQEYLEGEKKVNDFYYAGQFLQNPVPLGGGMFKSERLNIEESLPTQWTKRVRYWDKGGTKDGGCYTVGALLGKNCDGKVWVIDVKRGQWDAAEREKIIKQTAIMDGKDVIIGVEQEGGSGGKESAENTAKNLMGFKVRLDRPTGDKAARADPFATQVNAHNVNLFKAEWNNAYINELAYFPDSTYKDQVDASSGSFKLLDKKEYIVGVW